MDQAPTGYPEIVRHASPDGRIILHLVPGYDPGDVHEMQVQYRPKVAHDGVVLLNLADEPVDTAFEWQPGGGLKLMLSTGLGVSIDPEEGIYSTSDDGWAAHPIAGANSAIHKLLNPNGDQDRSNFRRRRVDYKATLMLIILGLGLAGLLWEAWHGRFYPRGHRIDTGSEISAWSLTCSDDRHVMMSSNEDGTLSFERGINAEPLVPVDGVAKRFSNGRSVVDIDGVNATIWFDGLDGKPLRCHGG
ncbi:Putative membrane protein [Sphingopyxis fribergensis]|uniref:Putative membrane protein n=1 Tax=Sphingopyxis fribergensis TaxID=1515612 RepID=A0A0A7PJ61_9SPHN|nr:hypothetical protein [Sphingopyxis fribergensis]AJA09238.1 Putative membrane protein [Sphingopyxis fribergensis]